MHFIDFLLHLICFIFWTLKTIYIFSFDYIIPIIGYVLPILSKYLSQLFSLVLRVFFTYIAPWLIRIVIGITYIFVNVLNGIGYVCMAIVESEINLEYAHAIAMLSIFVAIAYFQVTEKVIHLGHECYQMIASYVRFMLNLIKIMLTFAKYIYDKISSSIFSSKMKNKTANGKSKGPEKNHQKNYTNGTKHRSLKID